MRWRGLTRGRSAAVYHPDFVAFDPEGNALLVAEAKARTGTSASWAAKMRRNLLAHGLVPDARYFLLALPDRFYLWTDQESNRADIPPTYEIDAGSILGPYFEKAGVTAETISGEAFELIVAAWLHGLVQRRQPEDDLRRKHPWLFESGLIESIRGGKVEHEVVA
jgi:hypothetical protein